MPVPVPVPPVEPTAAMTAAIAAVIEAAVAAAVEAERARVVAWLRAEAFLTLYEATPNDLANRIERGDHRREETP